MIKNMVKKKETKFSVKWCSTHRGKTKSERIKCHKTIHGKDSKLPKRKYKKR